MNPQRNQRPVAPSGYTPQYSTSPFAIPPRMHPQYQYRPATYSPYGQSQYIQSQSQMQRQQVQPQRAIMASTNQRPILASPSTATMPTVVRKRNNTELLSSNGVQQAKKKRAVDRNIPEKLETLVPESRLYTELQDFERRVDATIMRKRLEIQEIISRPMKTKRILRVFISNTAVNQTPVKRDIEDNELEFGEVNTPAWILKIEGRLLDSPTAPKTTKLQSRKFSSFFKSIIVDLDRDPEMYPDGSSIEWNNSHNADAVDGFEIKRKGDVNVKCKIFFNLEQQPPKYKLARELAEILDLQEETKPGVIMALWKYIKYHGIQDNEDKRIINNDPRLEKLFNCPRIAFPQIPELVNRYLQPLDPITIEYTIRVDKEFHQSKYAYDIEVECDDPNKARLASVISNVMNQRELQIFDDKIVQCVQSINNSKTKRDFLLNFARSPVEFINKWVASQSRDLEVILGESRVNLEEQRRSNFYKQGWVNEAVFHYCNAQTQRKMHELLGTSNSAISGIINSIKNEQNK